MRPCNIFCLALSAIGLLLLTSNVQAQKQPETTANAAANTEHGQHLYIADGCYECHGYAGQGSPGTRLAPHPISAAAMAAYIRNPTGVMPPYVAAVLSDQDVADIHAFLAKIPNPPPADGLPGLRR